MFERFTDRARRVVVLAQEEARILNHHHIGTEHLLLGLAHEGEGVASKALQSLGVSLQAIRSEVEAIIGRGESEPPSGHVPFTPRAKKVLELSLREARQLKHDYIGTEHILLGLIREGEGVGAQVLVRLGLGLSRVRGEVVRLLGGQPGEAVSSGPSMGVDPRQILPEITQRGRRARELSNRLANALGDPAVSADDLLFGLLIDEDRLTILERYVEELERHGKEEGSANDP